MGCDSHLYLPHTAKQRDVADVLGILIGCKAERYSIDTSNGVFVRVIDGPRFQNTSVVGMSQLSIGGFWHWECDGNEPIPGARTFSCSRQEHRRPILEALASIFGGVLDFDDCDDTDIDFDGRGYKPYNPAATDDAAWDAWQTIKLGIAPVASRWQ
jgi:hypothetical protein